MKAKTQQTAVDWSRAKALHEALKAHGRRFLVNRILLGKELEAIRKQLGFSHGSQSRFSPSPHGVDLDGKPRTWEGWCLQELGISDETARRWIHCFEKAKEKAANSGNKAKFPQAARLLQMPSAEMTDSKIDELADCVERLLDEDAVVTQRDLLEDIGVRKQKRQESPKNKDGAAPNPEKDLLALLTPAYFTGIVEKLQGVSKEIIKTREYPNYKCALNELPRIAREKGEISLQSLKDSLEIIKESHEELLTKDLPKMISDVEEVISLKIKEEEQKCREMQGPSFKKARKSKAIAAR